MTLARDVYAIDDDGKPTNDEQQAVSQHLDLLACAFLVDLIEGWVPPSRSPKRMRTKPKRYFADPSLAGSQTTWSADIFTRMLLHLAETYRRNIRGVGKSLHHGSVVPVQAPELHVVYTDVRGR